MCKEKEQLSQKCCVEGGKFCCGSVCNMWRFGFIVSESGVAIDKVGGERIGMCTARGTK